MAQVEFDKMTEEELVSVFYDFLGEDYGDRNFYDDEENPTRLTTDATKEALAAFAFWQEKQKENSDKKIIEN